MFSLFSDPTQPQILSDNEDLTNIIPINRIELRNSPPQPLYSPPQVKRPIPQVPQVPHISHSPPELLNSPPRSLTEQLEPSQVISATPIARSQSNLDSVYRSRKLKLDSENIDNNKNKNQILSKYQLQRQYSCKDVPEKLPKNHDNNGIKHSTSEINLNNVRSSNTNNTRKNSFSNNKPSRNASNSNIPNVSRIPNPRNLDKNNDIHNSNPKNDVHRTNQNNATDIVNINSTQHYHTVQRSSELTENKPGLVKVPVDKPIGLDLEEFLPVSIFADKGRALISLVALMDPLKGTFGCHTTVIKN